MRLAISNIAWDTIEDEVIATLLDRFAIDAIDVAPAKYFPDPTKTKESDIVRVKNWWSEHGIEIIGMQALLFGTRGLNLFGPAKVQDVMLKHLDSVCRIGAGLGAKKLVFGSPRDRLGLSDQETIDLAVSFFRRLGDIAQSYGVIFCLEPNPTCYGANFMTTSTETLQIIKQIDHLAVKMQLDTGANTINREDHASILGAGAALIGHVHASEPDLLPLGDGGTDHDKVVQALKQYLPNQNVSIEMIATNNEPHAVSIERALKVAITFYRINEGSSRI